MKGNDQLIASIIVLAFNDRKYLAGCLSSLLDQSIPGNKYEVIYADNASSDGSVELVLEKFPKVRVIKFEKNYGFAEGNNRAATFAYGKYIAFQNPDTVAHKNWLSELLKALLSDPQIKASHSVGLPLNFGGYHERTESLERGIMCDLTRYGYVDFTEIDLDGRLTPTLHVAGGSMLIDPSILDELEYYFDPSFFMYNEDTDLGIRINNLGYRVVNASCAVTYHQRDAARRSQLNKKGYKMAYLVTRNRFITFYKNMRTLEFLFALPLIFTGSFIKLRTLPISGVQKVFYSLGLIPFTLACFIISMINFRKYSKKRKYILKQSKKERYWLLKELRHKGLPRHSPLVYGINPKIGINRNK